MLRIPNRTESAATTVVVPATCDGETLATATKKTYITMAPMMTIHSVSVIRPRMPIAWAA
jgi:hypothetical protein